jgi:hypothetical protein
MIKPATGAGFKLSSGKRRLVRVLVEAEIQRLSEGDVGCPQVVFGLAFVTTEVIGGIVQCLHGLFDVVHGLGDVGVSCFLPSHQLHFIGSRGSAAHDHLDSDARLSLCQCSQ